MKPLSIIWRYILAWLPMPTLALLNGILRELSYGRVISQPLAQQLASVLLITALTLYVYFLGQKWPLRSFVMAGLIGLCWLVFTMLLVIAFTYYILHEPLHRLLRSNDLWAGALWPLVLLTITVLPMIMLGIRKSRHSGQ